MMNKRTKIVCTLGPASHDKEQIAKMVDAGMNVARLNFSHGSHEDHLLLMNTVRAVSKEKQQPIAILQDLQGPKIRLGILPETGIAITKGQQVVFDTALSEYHDERIPIDYHELHQFLQINDRILISDGTIETRIISIDGTIITTEVVVGGDLFSHKGLNVPDSKLHIRSLTEKDKQDAAFGVAQGVDFMALSFVTSPEDILDLRFIIKEEEKKIGNTVEQSVKIIAKIERAEAIERIDAILDVVDGIMIARGDLGIEIPAEQVPVIQKKLIDKAREKARPVIVATQMLDSMQKNPRPTRAEVSDVAHAVMDHTDAVMLSNETATGAYPVESVQTMSNIIIETENSVYDDLALPIMNSGKDSVDDVLSGLSRILAEDVGARVILAASLSGETAKRISRYRPELPITVATNNERTERQLSLSWGVYPFMLPACHSIEELVERSLVTLKERRIIDVGERVIVVAGEPVGQAGQLNFLEVRQVS